MLLAVARVPPGVDGPARVAQALGVARAEVAHRLAGVLPRAVAFEAAAEGLERAAAELVAAGVDAFVLDQATVTTDAERFVGKTLTLGESVTVIDRAGASTVLAPRSVELLQRGHRTHSSARTYETKERKLAMGRAVLTGGLAFTRTETKQHTVTDTQREGFVVVHRCDGGPEVVLYERHLDYRFVQPRPQPAAAANLAWTLAALGRAFPEARVDDRVGRSGFLNGPLATLADGTDIALAMVREACRRGA